MQLEFHQLDRRWEHLRVRSAQRQRRLLASLAGSGQQTPIVVVAGGQPDHYLVIDGYKRIAALQQLGRDTVEAVIWPMSEAEALLLERSLRFSERETALEQGWLLAEMEQRFGYGLDELARRFDRSVSWVSRRLALVELLPEAIQQQVREGRIAAHLAMKFLAPVARISLDTCERMAAVFAQHRCNTRQAGQLYAAWRDGSPTIRKRILDEPELFFKAQRQWAKPPLTEYAETNGYPQVEPKASPTQAAALLRDLNMVVAIVNRASRRLAGAAVEMDRQQLEDARGKIERARSQLNHLTERIEKEQEQHVKPSPTHHDSGTEHARSDQARDRADLGNLPSDGAQSSALQLHHRAGASPGRESRTLPAADPGASERLQGESGASP